MNLLEQQTNSSRSLDLPSLPEVASNSPKMSAFESQFEAQLIRARAADSCRKNATPLPLPAKEFATRHDWTFGILLIFFRLETLCMSGLRGEDES